MITCRYEGKTGNGEPVLSRMTDKFDNTHNNNYL